MIRPTFTLIFFLALAIAANAQTLVNKQNVIGQLRHLRESISAITTSDADFSKYQTQCRTILNSAILKIDSRDNAFPEVYSRSLDALNVLAAKMSVVNIMEKNKIIALLYADLSLKFTKQKDNINSDDFVRLISVTVSVSGPRGAINNLRVNYCPLAYDIDYRNPDHFPRLTNPSKDEMVPGTYQMWLSQDGDQRVLTQRRVDIDPSKQNNDQSFYISGQ